MIYDLHVHTTLSDGKIEKLKLIKKANDLKLKIICFTEHNLLDHTTVETINQRYEKLYQNEQSVYIVPGVEFDASDYKGMHILAYGIEDTENLRKKLLEYDLKNDECGIKLLINIENYYGYHFTREEVLKWSGKDFLSKRIIVDFMVAQGLAKDYIESGQLYTAKTSPTYAKKFGFTAKEVIQIILNNGGIPVLAHPNTLKLDDELKQVIRILINYGLMGIEVFNASKTSEEEYVLYKFLAQKYNLLTTSGSDFHDYGRGVEIGIDNNVSDEIIKKLVK